MFGSNFFGNFGIPEQQQAFPYQSADAQGGMFGANTTVQSPMSQNDAGATSPIAGQPSPAGPAALGPSSPLSSADLGSPLGAAQPGPSPEQTQQAPAAGIATAFAGRQHG